MRPFAFVVKQTNSIPELQKSNSGFSNSGFSKLKFRFDQVTNRLDDELQGGF